MSGEGSWACTGTVIVGVHVDPPPALPLCLTLSPRLDPGEQLRVDGTSDGATIQVGLGAHPVKLDPSECESVAVVLLSVARVARHTSSPAAPAADLDTAEHGYRPEGEDAI